MNNSELEKKLKAARGPELSADYEEAFTRRVLASLRSAPAAGPWRDPWRPRLAWGFAMAAGLVLAFAAGHWHGRKATDQDVLADARLIQETLAMFPRRVSAIVRDERGTKLVLSEQEDVPASPPIYVRICDGETCTSAVTFSGQEIQVGGRKLTVLAEAGGGIILEGEHFVWSTGTANFGGGKLKIQAKNLKAFNL